jgi:hypothetical protein
MAALRITTVVAIATVAAACAPGEGELTASWAFADARDCQTSGARTVEVYATTAEYIAAAAEFECSEGETQPVVVGALTEGFYTVTTAARSADGALLYVGERVTSIAENQTSVAHVEMGFRGGEP